jgi:predicted lipoprotein with Yx(FWY)xxD motif
MNKMAVIGSAIAVIIVIAVGVFLFTGSKSPGTYASSTAATSAYTTSQEYTAVPATSSAASSSQSTTAATTSIAANTTSYTIVLQNSTAYGSYLANASGFALYTYTNDVPNSNASSCYSSCATNWPPFYAAGIAVSPGLNASNFGTIKRTDGRMQTTYKGWPLYLFVADHSAGSVNGNNVSGFKVVTK